MFIEAEAIALVIDGYRSIKFDHSFLSNSESSMIIAVVQVNEKDSFFMTIRPITTVGIKQWQVNMICRPMKTSLCIDRINSDPTLTNSNENHIQINDEVKLIPIKVGSSQLIFSDITIHLLSRSQLYEPEDDLTDPDLDMFLPERYYFVSSWLTKPMDEFQCMRRKYTNSFLLSVEENSLTKTYPVHQSFTSKWLMIPLRMSSHVLCMLSSMLTKNAH